MHGPWVAARGKDKPGKPQQPAQKGRQETKRPHRKTEPPTQDTEDRKGGPKESARKSKAFRVMFLARFSGRRPCFTHLPCSDPGVATLVLPTARWRVPTLVAPLLGSLSCSRSSMSLWAQWSVRFFFFFDQWIAGSLDRWIDWPWRGYRGRRLC